MALHPDFSRNHLVYVAYVALDPTEQARLRLAQLREVGGTLSITQPGVVSTRTGPFRAPRRATEVAATLAKPA